MILKKKNYENLYKFMLNLERLYKQKIVFCQHLRPIMLQKIFSNYWKPISSN